MNPDLAKRYSEQIANIKSGNTGLYGGITRPVSGKPVTTKQAYAKPVSGGVVGKVGAVLGQTARLSANLAGAAAKYTLNTAVDVGKSMINVGRTLTNLQVQPMELSISNKMLTALNQKRSALEDDYKAGKLSASDYAESLKNIRLASQEISDKLVKPIATQPSAKQQAADVAETTVNLLSLGRWSGIKTVAQKGAETVLGKSLNAAANTIQDTLLRIPAAKDLIARNAAQTAKREAQQLAGESVEQYIARSGKQVAAGLLIKRPLFYQQNINDATAIYNGMVQGNYGDALKTAGWVASQMLSGGPVGWFMKQGKNLGVKLRELSYGRQSLIDTISSKIGNNNPSQAARYLKTIEEKAPETFKEHHEVARI